MAAVTICSSDFAAPQNKVSQCRSVRAVAPAQPRVARGATPHPRYRAAAALCWSSHEEIPHVQGKRNPRKMIGAERGHQRADRLKPQSQTTSQCDHTDHSLFHSMKLSHAVWAPLQDGQVMVERSDRMWTTGEGVASHLTVLALRTP